MSARRKATAEHAKRAERGFLGLLCVLCGRDAEVTVVTLTAGNVDDVSFR